MTDETPETGPRGAGWRAVLIASAGLAIAVLVFVLVANNIGAGSRGPTGRQPEDTGLFVVGEASVLEDAVRRDGPLLLPDPLGGTRDIYIQHAGGQWRAFEARPAGSPRRCALRWSPSDGIFTDSCSPATYPADGSGLVTFPARVDEEGRVVVDLSRPRPPATHAPA